MGLAPKEMEAFGGKVLLEDIGLGEPSGGFRGGYESCLVEGCEAFLRCAQRVGLELTRCGGGLILRKDKLQPHPDWVQVVGVVVEDVGDDFFLERFREGSEVDNLIFGELLPS